MIIENKNIRGKKGTTVFYTVPNVRVENDVLYFDSFPMYTPMGMLTDSEEFAYFQVPADSVSIARDTVDLSKSIVVSNGLPQCYTNLENTAAEAITVANEGDIIIDVYIPADTGREIVVTVKEVS